MTPCPCLSDTLCCKCACPCLRECDGHVIHADCEKPPMREDGNREPTGLAPEAPAETIAVESAVPPNVAHLSAEQRAELHRQAEEEGITF